MEKRAFDPLSFAAVLAAGEAGATGLQRFGKRRNANLLSAGIDLGKEGKRINPNIEENVRNYLGNKSFEPYEAGEQIGKRMAGMEPERANRFLDKTIGMATARKDRLIGEGVKERKIPAVLHAAENYQIGRDTRNPRFNRFLRKDPVEGNANAVDIMKANVGAVPGVFVDSRSIIRPVLRHTEKTEPYKKVKNRFVDTNPTVKKTYEGIRNYID